MKFLRAFLLLNVTLFLAGCGEPAADVARPRLYEKDGLAFQHPSNWKIEEDQSLEGIRHLTIETRGDALVIVQMFPPGLGMPLEDYAREFAKAAVEELPMGRVVGSKFTPLTKSAVLTVCRKTSRCNSSARKCRMCAAISSRTSARCIASSSARWQRKT